MSTKHCWIVNFCTKSMKEEYDDSAVFSQSFRTEQEARESVFNFMARYPNGWYDIVLQVS